MTRGLLDRPTRFLFFTGKGGVGKTSLSSACAVALADRGRRVLLVSTDPASNLEDVFGIAPGSGPTPVSAVPGLALLDIDAQAAAREVRERTVGPLRGVLPAEALSRMEEELSGACTTEVAAFDAFVGLLNGGDPGDCDHVVFDTAPTGHTLRLLALPAAWDGFLRQSTTGTSCLGPLAALNGKRAIYERAVANLRDPARSTLVLVTRPERSAIDEAERTRGELAALGIAGLRLIVNGELATPDPRDALAAAYAARGRSALDAMPAALRALPTERVPLMPFEALGVPALRAFAQQGAAAVAEPEEGTASGQRPRLTASGVDALVDDLAADGKGLILVMGKGGVGKTTLAASIAAELARRGHGVRLSTTDPAAHLDATLAGGIPGLDVDRIDPRAETRRYVEHVLSTTGTGMEPDARALLEEDLRSPCTEEIAVFSAFSEVVREARRQFVVLDTAPTGHTLLLLDATGAYHRDVKRKASGRQIETPLDLLRDPAYTRVLLVALPQATPVAEAERLQEDLRRAGIEPWAWVLNRSLAAAAVRDPVLQRLASAELRHIARVRDHLARRLALVPWQVEAPVGVEGLRALVGTGAREAGDAAFATTATPRLSCEAPRSDRAPAP